MVHPWVHPWCRLKGGHSGGSLPPLSPRGCGEADERPRARLADDEGEEALPDRQGRDLGRPSDGGPGLAMRSGTDDGCDIMGARPVIEAAGRQGCKGQRTSWKTKMPEGLARVYPWVDYDSPLGIRRCRRTWRGSGQPLLPQASFWEGRLRLGAAAPQGIRGASETPGWLAASAASAPRCRRRRRRRSRLTCTRRPPRRPQTRCRPPMGSHRGATSGASRPQQMQRSRRLRRRQLRGGDPSASGNFPPLAPRRQWMLRWEEKWLLHSRHMPAPHCVASQFRVSFACGIRSVLQ